MIKIVLVDDHVLLRNGLATLAREMGYNILFEADNGKDLIQKLDPQSLPDIVILDINMPEMDGYATAEWIKSNYDSVKILALSMYDNDTSLIRMLQCGAGGYILKDSDPSEMKLAIESLMNQGFYYTDLVNSRLASIIESSNREKIISANKPVLTEREYTFLRLASSELTYKEIAEKMAVSPRTVDGYRDDLFEKLQLKSRVGLVMYAIKNGIVTI